MLGFIAETETVEDPSTRESNRKNKSKLREAMRRNDARKGRNGGPAARGFRKFVSERSRIHQLGVRGHKSVLRRQSTAAFFSRNNRYETSKLKCKLCTKKVKDYLRRTYTIMTTSVELEDHELCYHKSATDQFSLLLLAIQTIILSGGLILKLLDNAGITNSTELTEPDKAFNCDKTVYVTCTEPIAAFVIGWIVIVVMFLPFAVVAKMMRKAWKEMKREKPDKKKVESGGQGALQLL